MQSILLTNSAMKLGRLMTSCISALLQSLCFIYEAQLNILIRVSCFAASSPGHFVPANRLSRGENAWNRARTEIAKGDWEPGSFVD